MSANAPNFVSQALEQVGVGIRHETITAGVIVAVGITIFALISRVALRKAEPAVVPDEQLTARNFAELIAVFVLKIGDLVMGKENRRYLPFAGCVFFFILFCNLLGLIPGFSLPTDSF